MRCCKLELKRSAVIRSRDLGGGFPATWLETALRNLRFPAARCGDHPVLRAEVQAARQTKEANLISFSHLYNMKTHFFSAACFGYRIWE